MEFLDITSLGMTYRYVVKIEQKFKQKRREFGSANSSQPKQGKGGPNPHNKGQRKDGHSQDNQSKPQHKKGNEKTKKDTRKWCEYHKIPWHNTEECRSKQSLVVELKASKSEVDSDSESNPKEGSRLSMLNLVPLSLPPKSSQANQKNQRKGNASFTHICG
jgi:hypothetical protein